MKLVFTPNPEYIHKVLVVAHESQILDKIDYERTRPFDAETIWEFNPMGKVPSLVLDNGELLFGGLVICQYFDSLASDGKTVFPKDKNRWSALRQMSLGDGMFDATTLLRVEGWRDKAEWNMDYMLRERRKIIGCLDQMEKECPEFSDNDFNIGHICMIGGLSYLDLRNPIEEHAIVSGDENFSWRDGRPHLTDWFQEIINRPSVAWKLEIN